MFYGQGGAISIPQTFTSQAEEIENVTKADSSGLVNSLADFMINCACVDFYIETPNKNLTLKLNTWLNNINSDLKHTKVETGIKALAKQYFRERWTRSSLLLNRSFFTYNKELEMVLPSTSYFVKGSKVEIKEDEKNPQIGNEKYSLKISKDNSIKLPKAKNELNYIQMPYTSWNDCEPTPFYVLRGILHSLKFYNLLSSKSENVVAKAQELLEFVKKGNTALVDKNVSYDPKTLEEAKKMFEEYQLKIKQEQGSSPAFVNFDTEFEQLIPDYKKVVDGGLFSPIEKRIMQGFGMIDMGDEGGANSRKESVLNPRVMIEEVNAGIKDFKRIIKAQIDDIEELNGSKNSLDKNDIEVQSSPVSAFITKDLRDHAQRLYQEGNLSKQTVSEICGGGYVVYSTEVRRRSEELERGEEELMFAQIVQNTEQNISPEETIRKTVGQQAANEEKRLNKAKYTVSSIEEICQDLEISVIEFAKVLETSPYSKPEDLPARVKNKMNTRLQKVFIRVFNQALKRTKDETIAFKQAWSVISRVAQKNKEGKWEMKKKNTKTEISETETK